MARAINERSAYILPVRLDDTELPGLSPTVGYLDFRRVGVEGLVSATRKKLETAVKQQGGETVPPPAVRRVPRGPEELQRLLAQRPPAWEYLLYGAVLIRGTSRLEPKYRDHEIGFARRSGEYVGTEDVARVAQAAIGRLQGIVDNFNSVLDRRVQEAAFGVPGGPGNPDRITHIGERFVSVYEEFLDWAAELRGLSVSGEPERRVFGVLVRFVDQPLDAMRSCVRRLIHEADTFVERLERNEQVRLELTVALDIDKALSKEFNRALGAVARKARRR